MDKSVFVEQAAQEAAEAEIVPGDGRADALLREARARIYHWPADFRGFECKIAYLDGVDSFEGTLSTGGSRRIELDLPGLADSRWLRFQIEELLAHREAPEVNKMASKTGCSWGDWDENYGRRIDFLGDKMSSFYRIKDRKLTQIGRRYKGRNFIINIDAHHSYDDKFVANFYTAYYWSNEDEKLVQVETYLDEYQKVGEVHLPARRLVTEAVDGKLRSRCVSFSEPALLKEKSA
ncbi:MAG: DUF3386 family protein [Candidatus Eremiobacteraeota bacterium]|nr:DUF3386 family protein [Candidatus Eremiobacteraeota bacterium]